MIRHTHKYTIADDEAVNAFLSKLLNGKKDQRSRDRLLLRALDDAARHYGDSDQKVRQAFFHGLLTGYAVAFKLQQEQSASSRAKAAPTCWLSSFPKACNIGARGYTPKRVRRLFSFRPQQRATRSLQNSSASYGLT